MRKAVGVSGNDFHTNFLCSVTIDQVSQLDHDISTALANIREWRNTFAPINRLPLDILSLIPTHLTSQRDRFRASYVCRHWRRTFLRSAELWSGLVLSKGEVYVKTLLERAKGSPLVIDIVDRPSVLASTLALISSHTKQIKSLNFGGLGWADVQRFMDTNPGPFSFLDSLTLNIQRSLIEPDMIIPPSTRFFSTAVNLKGFYFYQLSGWSPPLSHFVFPNLIEFEFSGPPKEFSSALQLLDFLEASPILRRVHIMGDVSLEGVPRRRVVVLPNVKDLGISMTYGGPIYNFTTHVSCPSITSMLLTFKANPRVMIPEEMFPTPASWNAIIRQYTRSPVEEVTLQLNDFASLICTLSLRSTDGTIVTLWIHLLRGGEVYHHRVATEVTSTILNHPQLANIKRFCVCHNRGGAISISAFTPHITNEVGRLFKSLGPLDEFIIDHSDIQPYFRYFLGILEGDVEEPAVFPSIKKLTISHPMCSSDDECTAAIVGLAQSRHALGVPFEHVIVRALWMPEGVEEGLRPWVGNVEYCYDEPRDNH